MPRTRRSAPRTAPAAQSKLAFNNRVTKPNTAAQRAEDAATAKKIEQIEDQLNSEPEPTEIKDEDEQVDDEEGDESTIVEELPEPSKVGAKRKVRTVQGKNEREIAAEKVTDAQIKKYWQREEESRLAPRVHQSSLPIHEKILRHFDLSSQFGPCIGIPRLARWRRANTLGLEPPVEVLAVLLREEEGTPLKAVKGEAGKMTNGGPRGQGCGKIAYIDELAGGRVMLVE